MDVWCLMLDIWYLILISDFDIRFWYSSLIFNFDIWLWFWHPILISNLISDFGFSAGNGNQNPANPGQIIHPHGSPIMDQMNKSRELDGKKLFRLIAVLLQYKKLYLLSIYLTESLFILVLYLNFYVILLFYLLIPISLIEQIKEFLYLLKLTF